MFRSILAALDGTPAGDTVLELGLRWASRADALLVGLTVVDEPGLHGSEEALAGEAYFRKLNAGLLDDLRRDAGQALARYAARCAEAGVAFKPLQEEGSPAEQICEEAERFDLVLLGRRSGFRLSRTGWQGTNSGAVLKRSPRPVVVVPEGLPDAHGPTVVAYDGSAQAARAAAAFVAAGLGEGHPVWVVTVGPDRRAGARTAERAVEFLRSHGLDAVPDVVASSDPPFEALLDRVSATASSLLVMGAYGQPAVKEFFLGSTTLSALAECPVPLFLAQ